MIEAIYILFLLLPVVLVSGYYLGHKNARQTNIAEKNVIPADYIKGLNFLLNEQTDKAVQVFIDLLEVNDETVETHLALGHLFRRRGEVNQAIQIHQNLINHSSMDSEQRARALYQLGQDYQSAGLLDRAETLFNKLIEQEPRTNAALQRLIEIYQQEKDWVKAIEITTRLASNSNQDYSTIIAHYYCEQAEQLIRYNEVNKALKLLTKAIKIDPQCARATIIEGNILFKSNSYSDALIAFQRIEQQDPDVLPEVIDSIKLCYEQLQNHTKMRDYINNLQCQYGTITLVIAWVDVLQNESTNSAEQFLIAYLKKHASVRAMDKLIDIKQKESNGAAHENLRILKDITTKLLKSKPHYKCHLCGFPVNSHHWQCPGCQSWNTFKPL